MPGIIPQAHRYTAAVTSSLRSSGAKLRGAPWRGASHERVITPRHEGQRTSRAGGRKLEAAREQRKNRRQLVARRMKRITFGWPTIRESLTVSAFVGTNRPLTEASRRRNSLGGGPDSLRAAGHSVEAFDLPTANIDVSTTLDRTTIDMHSYPHGPSENKIERRSKTEAPRAFASASRSGKHPAYRQLCVNVYWAHGIKR